MASIRKEIHIDAPVEKVWDALRDVGALHTRLVPGFVTATRLNGNSREITFANGMTVREDIVTVDNRHRRVIWAIVGQRFHHYQGTATVEPEDPGCRFVWAADLLPDELAPEVEAMINAGISIIKKTMETAD
jgi:carbon monoxide dehydrogenase subunit G